MSGRNWCFTLNNYTLDEQLHLETIECRYIVFGLEVGVEGTEHIQGYIEFDSVKRLAGLKKMIPRAHFEPRRGAREAARDYCKKDGEWIERGDWSAGGQGKRSDIDDLVHAIQEKRDTLEILVTMPTVAARHMRFMEKLTAVVEQRDTREFRQIEVHVLWGEAGTGKTRLVHTRHDDVFTVNAAETFPFDGYDGQDVILLDDFYGGIPYHQLLRILDGYQYRVNVKGSHRYARWTKVYITSNKPPEQWYNVGLTPALARRLHHVTKFGNEVDGNTGEHPLLDI